MRCRVTFPFAVLCACLAGASAETVPGGQGTGLRYDEDGRSADWESMLERSAETRQGPRSEYRRDWVLDARDAMKERVLGGRHAEILERHRQYVHTSRDYQMVRPPVRGRPGSSKNLKPHHKGSADEKVKVSLRHEVVPLQTFRPLDCWCRGACTTLTGLGGKLDNGHGKQCERSGVSGGYSAMTACWWIIKSEPDTLLTIDRVRPAVLGPCCLSMVLMFRRVEPGLWPVVLQN